MDSTTTTTTASPAEPPSMARPLPPTTSRTNVTHKTQRSTRTSLLQSFIKPFANKIIRPGNPTPTGSPQLRAEEDTFKHCNVRQRQVEDIRLYDINSRSISTSENFIPAYLHDLAPELKPVISRPTNASNPALEQIQTHESYAIRSHDFAGKEKHNRRRKQIYYFAGGAWQSRASPEHWKLCSHIAHKLTSRGFPTTVTLISYPLAPENPASKTLPALEKLYYALLPPHEEEFSVPISANASTLSLSLVKTRQLIADEEVIFAGDSSGANVALSLVMHMLTKDPQARAPSSLFLISPAVDLRHTNPAMQDVAKNDPILTVPFVIQNAKTWAAEMDVADPRISPLLGDVSVFKKHNVAINGVIGSYDVLAPDAYLFREKCQQEDVAGEWLEWDKQMHCWPLAFSYKVSPDSNEAVEWILRTLQGGLPEIMQDKKAVVAAARKEAFGREFANS